MSGASLDAPALQALVERYFAAVDRMDVAATLACFAPHARFGIANHGVHYQGRDGELRGMYERLNARYARVWHGDFDHVIDVPRQRVASRFRVAQEQLQFLRGAGRPVRAGFRLHERRELAGLRARLRTQIEALYQAPASSLGRP